MENTTETPPYDIEEVEHDLAELAGYIQEIRDMDNVLGIPTKPVANAFQAVYDEELEIHQDMLKQMEAAGLLTKQGVGDEQNFLEIRGSGDIRVYVLDFDNEDLRRLSGNIVAARKAIEEGVDVDENRDKIEGWLRQIRHIINDAIEALIADLAGGIGNRPVIILFHGWTVTDSSVLGVEEGKIGRNIISEKAGFAERTSDWFNQNYGHLPEQLQPIVIMIDWDSSDFLQGSATGLPRGRDNAKEIGPALGQLLDTVDNVTQGNLLVVSHSLGMAPVVEMLENVRNPNTRIDAWLVIQSAVQEDTISDDHPIWNTQRVDRLITTQAWDVTGSVGYVAPTAGANTSPGIGYAGISFEAAVRRSGIEVSDETEQRWRREIQEQMLADSYYARLLMTDRREFEIELERRLIMRLQNEPDVNPNATALWLLPDRDSHGTIQPYQSSVESVFQCFLSLYSMTSEELPECEDF